MICHPVFITGAGAVLQALPDPVIRRGGTNRRHRGYLELYM